MSNKLQSRLRAVAVGATNFATVLTMSGVVYLAPVASAQTIMDGDVVKTSTSNDVYILKLVGAKKFKRLILNPDIFNSYGHLSWSAIKTVSQATLDMYTTSTLVIEVNADGSVFDPKVYAVVSPANSDTGTKHWFDVTATQFEAGGLDWDSIAKINHTEAAPTFYPAGTNVTSSANLMTWATNVSGGGTTPAPTAGLSVMLAGTDASSKVSAMGAQDVVFSTVKLSAGSAGAVKINSIEVTRGLIGDGGITADANFTNVKLFRNSVSAATKVGSTLTLNTTTHVATFTNLNWTVNAGQMDTLIITGSIAATGITGNVMMLGLRGASAIALDGTSTVSGTFPVFGSKVSPATTAVGQADLDILATPADGSPLAGSTDQHVATLQFESETEDFRVDSVKIRNIGTATPSDVSNLKLKYGSVVLATIPALAADNSGTFNIVAPANENIIKAGNTRNFNVYTDVGTGTAINGRTIDIEVTQAADAVVVGQTSGGVVTILSTVAGGGTAYAADSGAAHTIARGSLTASLSAAYNPSAGDVIVGTENNKATAIRFSASNSEAVRVTQLTITEQGTSADTDVSAVKLTEVAADGTVGAILAEGVLTSGSVQFGTNDIQAYDTDYLFEVPKGGNKDVYVVVSVPTGAAATTIILSVAANGDVKSDGTVTMGDLAACTACTATGNTMTIVANGTVTISSSGTTAAATYVKGAQDKEFARFTATTSAGESVTISAFNLLAVDSSNAALTTANSPTDVRVYKDSVTSANLLGTVASPSTGVANFSFTDTIPASTVRTYIVTGDIPTTTGATTMSIEVDAEADVTATGASSGITGTAVTAGTYSVQGSDMTVTTGHLGVIASSLPVYTNITEKSSGVEVARFVLASGTNGETVRVTSLKFTLKGTAGNSLSVDAADLSSITLYDVAGGDICGTGCKTKLVGSLTSAAATFSGLSIDITSGSQKTVGVKVNIGDSTRTTPYVVMGIENYYTDVAASGLDSLSSIYANQLRHATSGIMATLFAAFVLADLDMTLAVQDADDELSAYGVPSLGITAVADNAVITVDSEHMLVQTAATSLLRADVGTVTDRAGWGGTTAAAHSTTGVPIILHIPGTASVSSAGNNFTTNSDTSIVATTTVAAAMRVGQLTAQHDLNVDNGEDDIKLVTAITANGLTVTEIDAYSGTAFAEDTGNDQFVTAFTNYGQAQAVQAVGTLTLAVASATPKASQVVAGATGVEFSRVKLTSLYEKILVTKVQFTRTGDTNVDSHIGGGSDGDFASVYLQNMTDATWGPNGNGKSNTVSVVNGLATFNFTDANAFVVDPNVSSGMEFSLRGNLNAVNAGVTSGDAPKFFIDGLDTVDLTAKGYSTGTTLSAFTAGSPTPATAANFNALTILKGKLDIALNSGSLSGNQTRASNQTVLKLDFDSADSGSVVTFRAGTVNVVDLATTDFDPVPAGTDTNGDWAVITVGDDVSTGAASATNRIGSGANSFLFTQGATSPVAANGWKYDGVNLDLSDYSGMAFWWRQTLTDTADNFTFTLTGATAGSHTIATGNMENGHWYLIDIPFSDATTAFTGLTAVTGIQAVSAAALAAGDIVNVDQFYIYKDKVKVAMASNAGLDGAETAVHTTSADLKDGATVLATAFYSGDLSSTAAAELSAGHVTFIPTTQFTIPTTGKTLSVVSDTTALITGAKTLAMNIGLGSATNAGVVTDGNVFWYDDSFDLSDQALRWVDSVIAPVQSGTISYQ